MIDTGSADMLRPPVPRAFQWQPHAVLDAGGDSSAALSAALYRAMHTLADGQILHVISSTSDSLSDVMEWCSLQGHELLAVQPDRDETLYWIRK
jgi:TusA-related sulfurtransferase